MCNGTAFAAGQARPPGEGACPAVTTLAREMLQPGGFYDAKRLREVDREVQQMLAQVHRRHAAGAPYKEFPLQALAFEWVDAHKIAADLRVFSIEREHGKGRSFLATTVPEFWRRYLRMPAGERHHYEIIRDGRPCHLYFVYEGDRGGRRADLEYPVEHNAGADGTAMVDALLRMVAAQLQDDFGLTLEPGHVLELDSTTERKFSRHLVIALQNAAFANNLHAGAFVRRVCGGAEALSGPLAIVKDGSGARGVVVDLGVYTRNRAFRLHLSSKVGKVAMLLPTDSQLQGLPRPPDGTQGIAGRFGAAGETPRKTFLRSLIGVVEPGCALLQCQEVGGEQPLPGCCRVQGAGLQALPAAWPAPQHGPSPFLAIDAFITSVCCQGGRQGWVRSWLANEAAGLLLLNMGGNRWCGRIGREHRSNGIFYVVDLTGGMWYQKCYDPECRTYRSEAMPLPREALASLPAWSTSPLPDAHFAFEEAQALAAKGMKATGVCAPDGHSAARLPALMPPLHDGAQVEGVLGGRADSEEDAAALQAMEVWETGRPCT